MQISDPKSQIAYEPWVHRLALATAVVALLPIVVGAMVTTMGAGMAFPDWPTSDGHNMLLYPWFQAASDKFVEHGHRLAGMLVGLFSIALAAVVLWKEPRRPVRAAGLLVLVCVIGQGILGGMRVLANRPDLAMVHGHFAALVFALMAAVALVTGRSWLQAARVQLDRSVDLGRLKPLAVLTPIAIFGQSLLGGAQRHLNMMLHEHLAGAVVVLLFVVPTAVLAWRSRIAWLRGPAVLLVVLLAVQASLGAGAWVTKWGFPPLGHVAVHGTAIQIGVRSSHTVVGMLLLTTSISLALRVYRLDAVRRPVMARRSEPVRHNESTPQGHPGRLAGPVAIKGGAA